MTKVDKIIARRSPMQALFMKERERKMPAFVLRQGFGGRRRAKVEPERIELSSREDNIVLSTCLVDFILSGTTRQATA